jgi:polyhydroxybutyrate depolymerase
VSVLEVHGDADDVIRYEGGRVFDRRGRDYPGANETVRAWASRDGCDAAPHTTDVRLDLDDDVPGPETTQAVFGSCRDGASVGLWTIHGGGHVVRPTSAGLQAIWGWMAAHTTQAKAKAN